MPWKETSVMKQREMLIKAWLSQRYSKQELCQQFDISRSTVNKWIQRHYQFGLEGLADQTKKPKHSPNATATDLCEQLIAAKHQRPHWGAKKLLGLLRQQRPDIHWPADSTGELILKRAGPVQTRQHRRRFSADSSSLMPCNAANQSWSADFKGDFVMRNGRRCYPLTLSDNYSRKILHRQHFTTRKTMSLTLSDNYSRKIILCNGLQSTAYKGVQPLFERAFIENGMPYAILSDNGTPFASKALGGLSRLSKWWIDLGIQLQRINPGHPEQNGRHERMHRSLKEYLKRLNKIERDLASQQRQSDAFMQEYNEERIHEGLNSLVPQACYRPSVRNYTGVILPYEYDSHCIVRRVRSNGEAKWRGRLFYISEVLVGENIALLPYAEDLWQIFYRFHPLGLMNDRLGKIQPLTE